MPPLEEEKIIGERFALERERMGLSQQKFGDLVGLQPYRISVYLLLLHLFYLQSSFINNS